MEHVYLIRRKSDGKYLNAKGEWSKSITSYRLKEFSTEEAAQAGIPEGVACTISRRAKRNLESKAPSDIVFKYYLQDLKSYKFIDSNDEFKVPVPFMHESAFFDTEDLALDKAESLGMDLDNIKVLMMPYHPEQEARLKRIHSLSRLKK